MIQCDCRGGTLTLQKICKDLLSLFMNVIKLPGWYLHMHFIKNTVRHWHMEFLIITLSDYIAAEFGYCILFNLQADGFSYWDREANSSSAPEMLLLQAVGHVSTQHPCRDKNIMVVQDSNRFTRVHGAFSSIKSCDFGLRVKYGMSLPSWKETAIEINTIFIFCDVATKWFMSTSSERKLVSEVLFKAAYSVQWAHSLGWWMKRKVEEDMVNVAPNLCVQFHLGSP